MGNLGAKAGIMLTKPHPAIFGGTYAGKTVLITGHTGFKGSWLTLWLRRLGAKVVGYALEPPTNPSLFAMAGLAKDTTHVVGDVRDRDALTRVMREHEPDMIFHLAAQPLVRQSYREPAETYDINVMGTVNVLEAVRQTPSVRACIVVTSDKCYENREWDYAYRENDSMGGYDPYSSSKGCAELVTSAYRNSFFHPERHLEHGVALASVRAGNVIGGGDWAEDRIVPDCIRALVAGEQIIVRNPSAIRPWQHVLEPLSGYLWLGVKLLEDCERYAEGWNFGPNGSSNVPVSAIVENILSHWGSGSWICPEPTQNQPHEARFLKLDTTKATNLLPWAPAYDLRATMTAVVEWYSACHRDPGFDATSFTLNQIMDYERKAASAGAAWAQVPCEVK